MKEERRRRRSEKTKEKAEKESENRSGGHEQLEVATTSIPYSSSAEPFLFHSGGSDGIMQPSDVYFWLVSLRIYYVIDLASAAMPSIPSSSGFHEPIIGLELRSGSEEEGELEVQDETRVRETESVVVNIRPRRSASLDSSSVANVNLVLANVQSSVQSGENEGIVSKRFIAGNENFPTTSNSKRSSSFRTRYLHSVLLFYWVLSIICEH
ncbi:hypothetical protein Lal_00017901 [Lupinus albus]|nr:hypothetical protein Lal_00018359 [Lupinus albus]KAF1866518.1 hypothetical protein Lal_00017901 [Lupinus albus]